MWYLGFLRDGFCKFNFFPLNGLYFPFSLYALWFCCCWKLDIPIFQNNSGNQNLPLPRDFSVLNYWRLSCVQPVFWQEISLNFRTLKNKQKHLSQSSMDWLCAGTLLTLSQTIYDSASAFTFWMHQAYRSSSGENWGLFRSFLSIIPVLLF